MHNLVKETFKILGVVTLSFMLFNVFFGATGRTFMWKAIEPAMQRHWSESTLQDGKVISDTFIDTFEHAKPYGVGYNTSYTQNNDN